MQKTNSRFTKSHRIEITLAWLIHTYVHIYVHMYVSPRSNSLNGSTGRLSLAHGHRGRLADWRFKSWCKILVYKFESSSCSVQLTFYSAYRKHHHDFGTFNLGRLHIYYPSRGGGSIRGYLYSMALWSFRDHGGPSSLDKAIFRWGKWSLLLQGDLLWRGYKTCQDVRSYFWGELFMYLSEIVYHLKSSHSFTFTCLLLADVRRKVMVYSGNFISIECIHY